MIQPGFTASLEVRVGTNPISATSTPKSNGNLLCGTLAAGATTPTTIRCPYGTAGRYVSVQRISATPTTMTLCEVQVRTDRVTRTGAS